MLSMGGYHLLGTGQRTEAQRVCADLHKATQPVSGEVGADSWSV